MRDELLQAVRGRVEAADRGDPDPALAAEARTEAEQLLEHLGTPDGADAEVLHAVGLLHWVRWTLLYERAPVEAAVSAQLAVVFLTPVCLIDPTCVPPALAEDLEPQRAPGEAGNCYDLGCALTNVAFVTGELSTHTQAIELLATAARDLTDTSDVRRPDYLAALGASLRIRYERRGESADLANALGAMSESISTTSENAPDLPGRLAELGFALRLEFERTGNAEPLRRAVEVVRRAARICPPDLPERAELFSHVTAVLTAAAAYQKDAELAREAVSAGREAVSASDPNDLQRVIYQSSLARALLAVQFLAADDAISDEALELIRLAVASASPTDPHRPVLLCDLGYQVLLASGPDPDDIALAEAMSMFEQAADATPHEHTNFARCQAGFGTTLRLHWARTDDPVTLERAVDALRAATDAVGDAHQLLPGWLDDLAMLAHDRCLSQPDLERIDFALAVLRRLGTVSADRTAGRSQELASLLLQRFELTGDTSALAEGTTLLRGRMNDPTLQAELRAMAAHNLSFLLLLRYERVGEQPILDEAIDAARQAVAAGADGTGEQAERLANLGTLLARRDALDEAIRLGRHAVSGCPADHLRRPSVLRSLADTLHIRYLRFGDPAELDEGVALLREAMTLPAERGGRGVLLSSLASKLRARHDRSPDLATLEEALAIAEQALAELPASHPERTKLEANLAVPLREHYQRTGDPASLTRALEVARRAVAATPEDHPARGLRLTTVGIMLNAQFQRTGDPAALDEALEVERKAVACTPAGSPDRARIVSNLSVTCSRHYELTGNRRSIEAAVNSAREAASTTPADHPSRAVRLLNLAVTLSMLIDATGDEMLALEALRVAEAAAGAANAVPSVRLRACRVWGRLAAATDQWETAAEAFGHGVRLLPLVAPRNLRRADLEHQLAGINGVHVNAAASELCADNPAGALEVLEQGRGVLLSYALDTRSELTDLRATAPELAAEWERLLREFEDDSPEADQRYGLAARWQDMVTQVRATDGFDRFLTPPSIDELAPAAAAGAVVTINVSELRCDALVLTTVGVSTMPLPELTAERLEARVGDFLGALHVLQEGDLIASFAAQSTIQNTLVWLWDVVAEPVLTVLGHTATPPSGSAWPRIWWSPTGLLNFVPLHAAGRHDVPGSSVPDRAVSSYTPTIRALLHARCRPAVPDRTLLAVAMPRTPGQAPLPATGAEAHSLTRRLGGRELLVDSAATHAAVLAGLESASWAHFACHAYSDPLSPSESHLLLHDRTLSVTEISRLRLKDAELAYLSACSTARGSDRLADEAIHIASAFQLAGYRHVVGALWPVYDVTSAEVAEGFYGRVSDGMSPAEALHEVIRELRDAHPRAASLWAGYVHAGP